MRSARWRTTSALLCGLVLAAAPLTAPAQPSDTIAGTSTGTSTGTEQAATASPSTVPTGTPEDLGPPLPQRPLSPDQALGEGLNGEPLAFFLPRGNDDVPAEFTVVDIRTQEVVFRQKVPSGNDSWGVEYSAAEKAVYLGMRSGELYRYEIGSETIEPLGTPMPGEQILMLEVAADGVVFGGTYPNGHVFSYDPATGDVRDYGQVLGQPYVRSIAVTDDTIWAGTRGEARLAEIDRSSGELTEIPLPEQYRSRLAVYDLFHVRDDRLLLRTESPPEHEVHVFDLGTREFVDTVEVAGPRMVSPVDPTTGKHVYFRVNEGEHSGQIARYDLDALSWEPTDWSPRVIPGDFRWVDMDDPDFPGLSLAVTYYRGDIDVHNFRTGNSTSQEADLHAPPARLASLDRSPDGDIYVSGQPGMARWSVEDDALEELSGGGGAQGFGSWGEDLLIGKYPGGGLRVYDTASPWDPGAGNPTGSMPIGAEQDRPFAFAELPGRVAVGSAPESGLLGGALTLWNPDTGDTEVFRDVVADQSVVSLAFDGDLVWGGTSITGGFGAEPKASEAVLFAFDPRTREVVYETAPVPEAEAVSGLAVHAGQVWGIADGTLFAVDLDTREVSGTIDLGHDTTEPHGRDFEIVVDDAGRMFASSTKKLHYIDRARWQAHVLADNAVEDLALDDHGDLYYRSGARLFRFSPSPATGPECDRIVDGHHAGALAVTDGVTCVHGAAVSGRVEVSAGAGLVVTGGELSGGLTARGASTVRLNGADVAGATRIESTTGPVVVTDATISGAVTLADNAGGENVITGTTISGTLACTGNEPAPVHDGTTASAGATGQCAPDGAPGIEVLSSRPDAVSGGDALVRVTAPPGVEPGSVDVELDGADVTGQLSPDPAGGTLTGVVSGLPDGAGTLTASTADGTPEAELRLTNHPITGPVFSGPHEEPFVCDTERFELVTGELLGPPLDDDCSVATRVDYMYRTTGDRWAALPDGETRPDDLAWTTTSTGAEVPYIVRVETGTINRGIYETAVLHDPETAAPAPGARPAGWNGRLVYRFGGGCPRGWYVQGDRTGRVLDGGMLEQGYAVASSSLNVFGNNCNDVLAAETMSMVKERFVEAYGPPESTLGWGSSGGAYQVHQIGDNYPGLLDGIIAGASFPDVASGTLLSATDAGLLHRYFTETAPGALTREQQRAVAGFGKWGSIAKGANSARRIDPRDQCPEQLPESLRYDPETHPDGARCDVYSHHANVYGVDDNGVVRRPLDNVGVQYGLGALEDGVISVEAFLDLNERIGGLDADANHVPQRTEADPEALETAYRTGRILRGGGGLAEIPIIDFRLYFDDRPNGDNHQRYHSFSTRQRLIAANGTAANHVMLVDEREHGGFNSRDPVGRRALAELDAWVTAIENDDRPADEPIDRIARNRPDWLVDSCWTRGENPRRIRERQLPETEGSTCAEQYPVWSSPRMVAGGPLANDVLKCRLEPVGADDYAVEFTAAQLDRAREIFDDGVCDWSRPGVGQQELAGTWLRFPRPGAGQTEAVR
ncbi:hypothetical protein CLV30_11663 [Haloactinopolyspora alba]|uniref:DUF6351 domain-containing protein n=1 Tax=Haloactinopolyspora alba TaxID=648780 RepID=A0A2P8DT61_9ACTN|nr:DUF6351 family protein [Haloactinopolyspora alba]PSL00403.1 hypothetical protein CLV30_11663 [Haloactinopolyspora alba]